MIPIVVLPVNIDKQTFYYHYYTDGEHKTANKRKYTALTRTSTNIPIERKGRKKDIYLLICIIVTSSNLSLFCWPFRTSRNGKYLP